MGVVELVRFRLVAGTDDDAFMQIDKRFETQFAYRQPGFVRRMLLRADDGAWVSHVLWSDRSHADAAWALYATDAHAVARNTVIDMTTVERELLTGHD